MWYVYISHISISCNFHTIYFMNIMHVAEDYLLEDIKNYRYLSHGNVPCATQDDKELYRQLVEAMEIMGFNTEEVAGL